MGRTSRRSERDSREPIRGPGGAGTSEARVRRRGSGRVPSGSRRGRRCLTGSSRPVAWTRARFTVEEARVGVETLKSVSSEIRPSRKLGPLALPREQLHRRTTVRPERYPRRGWAPPRCSRHRRVSPHPHCRPIASASCPAPAWWVPSAVGAVSRPRHLRRRARGAVRAPQGGGGLHPSLLPHLASVTSHYPHLMPPHPPSTQRTRTRKVT